MNLPRMDRAATVDFSLSRMLKNWMGRKQPPANARERLLRAAAAQKRPKASLLSVYQSLSFEPETDLWVYRLKMTDVSSLQISAFGMC